MTFKPKIFIGSSKEGLSIAKKVEEEIKEIADVVLWTGIFELGVSAYDDLITQIPMYDFAILVATADDILISRKTTFNSARDNVLFEFGLFAGGLGKSRVFYIVEDGVKIPSDLSGIALPYLSKRKDRNFNVSLNSVASKIKQHVIDKEKTYDLGMLPSTALAFGYFSNFVERMMKSLLESKAEGKPIKLDGEDFQIKSLKFTILIPNDLSEDMFKKVAAKRFVEGWKKTTVTAEGVRDFDFSVDRSLSESGNLFLVDIPITLNALSESIDLYAGKRHLGKNKKETLLEAREIRNFKRTLEYLISNSSFAKHWVNVEVVEI